MHPIPSAERDAWCFVDDCVSLCLDGRALRTNCLRLLFSFDVWSSSAYDSYACDAWERLQMQTRMTWRVDVYVLDGSMIDDV
jgi:hypothetical protein